MARHPERRSHGQPQTPSAPKAPQFREVTRYSGVYLKEIRQRADEFAQAFPDADRDELIATISLKEAERPRVDGALDALNQLSALEIKGDEIGTRVRSFVVQQMTPPGSIVYEATWTGDKPESLTKPKAPVAQPTQSQAPKPAQYEFKSAEQRDAERQARVLVPPPQPRWKQEKDQRRARRAEQEKWEKIHAEREAIEQVVIDTGRERGEKALADPNETRIELGDDGIAKIVYHISWRTNPDGTNKMGLIDRATGRFDPEDMSQLGYALRADIAVFLEWKCQVAEGKEVGPWEPRKVAPEKLQEIYDRAVAAEVIVVKPNGEFDYMTHGDSWSTEYGRMDLDRNVVEPTQHYSKQEKPINPQFAEFLKSKQSPSETTAKTLDHPLRPLYEQALEDGSLIVRVNDDGKVTFSWRYGGHADIGFYTDIDIAKGRTKPYELSFQGDPLIPGFAALLAKEEARLNGDKQAAQALMEKTHTPDREVVKINVSEKPQ